MSRLPNRFGFIMKAEPNKSNYFDCLQVSMSKGVLSVDVANGKREFLLSDLLWFNFEMTHDTMLACMARSAFPD